MYELHIVKENCVFIEFQNQDSALNQTCNGPKNEIFC